MKPLFYFSFLFLEPAIGPEVFPVMLADLTDSFPDSFPVFTESVLSEKFSSVKSSLSVE
jgi:hypothetical protein